MKPSNNLDSHAFFQGVPSFFRASCAAARVANRIGYAEAGWHFGLHCAGLLEPSGEDDVVEMKLNELYALLDRKVRNDKQIFAWFKREFPRCMDLVPGKRRGQFLKGIYLVYDERGI